MSTSIHNVGYEVISAVVVEISDLWEIVRLCGKVVRVPGYRSRGSGFDSQLYQIF
jgi:hypothetical protein